MDKIEIVRFADIDSTNRIALELGLHGAANGTVVHARQQSGGRGRNEKLFVSPPGGLYISIIIRPELDAKLIPLVTLAAGVACCQTVEELTGLSILLKWPNDLYVDDKKLAGILTESAPFSAREGKIPFLVVGIGLNVNTDREMFPPSLQDSVTSVYCLKNKQYDHEKFIAGIVNLLDKYVANLVCEKQRIFTYWKKRDYLYGRELQWDSPSGEKIYGIGAGLQSDGCYRLKTSDTTIHSIIGGGIYLTTL